MPGPDTTDMDDWKAFLTRFGIEFKESSSRDMLCLEMEMGMRKVSGYSGFVTVVEFDETGKFVQIGAWE